MAVYTLGETVRLTTTFKVGTTPTDPTTIELTIGDAAGTPSTYTYAGLEISRSGAGVYYKEVVPDTAGTWLGRWVGAGDVDAIEEVEFDVVASAAPWTTDSHRYATLSQLRQYLGGTASADDVLLRACLDRATAEIDTHCRRRFDASGTATREYDDGCVSGEYLWLDDDLLSVSTLTNGNGVEIAADGYWLEPRNISPASIIRLKSSEVWSFNTDGRIEVEGIWGYSTTPPGDIVQATLRLGAYIYRQRDAQVFETTADVSAGIMTIPMGVPKDVELILKPYRRMPR